MVLLCRIFGIYRIMSEFASSPFLPRKEAMAFVSILIVVITAFGGKGYGIGDIEYGAWDHTLYSNGHIPRRRFSILDWPASFEPLGI